MERGCNVVSLDAPVSNTEDKALLDLMVDPVSVDTDQQELERELQEQMPRVLYSMETLPEKERLFIQKRFGINGFVPHTYKEIADTNQISRERVRQIIEVGLRKIRYQMSRNGQAPSANRRAAAPFATATASAPNHPPQVAPEPERELHPAWQALQTAA
jgi:DNA-directed RNA polymerase sigma subunit (sigma70/sigma32)